MATETPTENPKKRTRLNPLPALRRLGSWLFIAAGIAGVTWMLLAIAGVFHEKVPDHSAGSPRKVPDTARVVAVERIRQPRFESAVGEIQPVHESSVAARILARVEEVNVTAGQNVVAGEILVKLNDADLQARLRQAESARDAAEARVQQANSDFARARQLIDNNAISRSEFDAAAATVKTTEADLQRARQAIEEASVLLDYTVIRAPFDAMVVDKQVEPGDTATPGQVLLTLYDPNNMQLVANVRESLAMKLVVGQQIKARLETLDHECLATVREVVPQADSASRSFQVKVTGPCPPGIYSGMFGRIQLPLEEESLLVIPVAAVRRVGQLTLVDVAEGGNAIRRSVRIGRTIGDRYEVLAGLIEGEAVVVGGSDPVSGDVAR